MYSKSLWGGLSTCPTEKKWLKKKWLLLKSRQHQIQFTAAAKQTKGPLHCFTTNFCNDAKPMKIFGAENYEIFSGVGQVIIPDPLFSSARNPKSHNHFLWSLSCKQRHSFMTNLRIDASQAKGKKLIGLVL